MSRFKIPQATLLLALTPILLASCETAEDPIDNADRWAGHSKVRGFTIEVQTGPILEAARLRHNPANRSAATGNSPPVLTDVESEAYDRLNGALHQEVRRVTKAHFATTPIPSTWDRTDDSGKLQFSSEYFTAFTYQNYDWYAATYDCPLRVITDYVSAELLLELQALLVGPYHGWCVYLVLSDGPDFDDDHEVAIFSDQVIMSKDAAASLRVPGF